MDVFSPFSTAPSSGGGSLLPNHHTSALGSGFSTSSMTFDTRAANGAALSSPHGVSAGVGLGVGDAGAAAPAVSLFSTVPSSQPKPAFLSPRSPHGVSAPSTASDALLFSTAAGTVAGERLGTPSSAGWRSVQHHLKTSREFDPADSATYAAEVHRALDALQALGSSGPLSQSRLNGTGGGGGAATAATSPGAGAQALPTTTVPSEAAVLAEWAGLIDAARPAETAARLNTHLERTNMEIELALKAVSACLTTPAHLAIVPQLAEPHRRAVRDYVLQTVLEAFENPDSTAESSPLPHCALMMTEMVRLGLVRLKGVAETIATFLLERRSRRACVATFGLVAELCCGSDAFLREMRQLSSTEQQLLALYKEPEYEHDVLAINRLLSASGRRTTPSSGSGGSEDDQVGTILRQTYQLKRTGSAAPPSCLQYVSPRDELFTAHGDGVIALWGPAPTRAASTIRGDNGSNGEDASALPDAATQMIIEMPHDTLPVAMATPHRGHFIVAAGIPVAAFGPAHPFAPHWQARHPGQRPAPVSPPPGSGAGTSGHVSPLLRLLVCSESTGGWTQSSVIKRPAVAAITAVAAMTQHSCVCSAEATRGPAGSGQWHHNICFINAPTGQLVHTMADAHTDFITAMSTCADTEHILLSTARPGTVKLWDARVNGSSAVAATAVNRNAALYTMPTTQTDSITSLRSYQNLILTSSLDGSFVVWDTRDLSRPVAHRQFTSPVLDLAPMEGGKWAVATARGLFLVSDELHSMDVIPNVAYTQICANNTGELLFAAGGDGVSIFSVRRQG